MKLHITYLKLIATAIIWGGTFIAGRIAVQSLGAFTAAFLRFAIASFALFLVVWQVHGHIPKLQKSQYWAMLGLGLTGIFGYNALFFGGLQTVEAGRASLIIALNPVAIALGAALFFNERLNQQKIIGIVISLLGAAWVISKGNWQLLGSYFGWGEPAASSLSTTGSNGLGGWGELMLLGCVFSWMSYTLIGKAVMRSLSPLVASAYACWVGSLMLLPVAWHEGLWPSLKSIQPGALASVLYLGVLGSAVGFCWYYDGLKAIGPARASAFINLVPVSAILLAALLLQEALTSSIAIGAILVVLGVSVTNKA